MTFRSWHRWLTTPCLTLLFGPILGAALFPSVAAAGDPFLDRHPRLLFASSDLPALRAKVHDGGADDASYAFIRDQLTSYYLVQPYDSLLRNDFALEATVNTGLAAYFEDPIDTIAVDLGRRLTQQIARNWGVDTDAYGSSLRLRSLALGYDMFFGSATDAQRQEIRDEITSYISYFTNSMNYDIWRWSPYVSNKSAMVAAALGLGSIAVEGEVNPAFFAAGLARADVFYRAWRDAQLAGDGAYREGTLYASWSLRNLIYYFEARRRFDGYDFSQEAPIRAMERWFPYELDPRGGARLNNIQDQTDYYFPLARHTTYWDWAMTMWGSGIASYVWEHAAGVYGRDMYDDADKAATVMWHRDLPATNPQAVLPLSAVWEGRGLYYFRTGWPSGAASDDVVLSFYSGEFRGGHAQEDQNQFTLAAYGEKLVVDHGAGSTARQSEAHNLVRIDGLGQHNAGGSIGTDGRIESYVLSPFADYVCGDARLAYSTHSPYNNTGVPYPWSDWSWGFSGANPVEMALRRVVSIRAGATPYFIIADDIRKDDDVHRYDWCVHVPADATVDASGNPIRVTKNGAALDIHVVRPLRSRLAADVSLFDNQSEDPNSRLLTLSIDSADPRFLVLLVPRRATDPEPVVAVAQGTAGAMATVAWADGAVDYVSSRAFLTTPPVESPAPFPAAGDCSGAPVTDAVLAQVRKVGAEVRGYVLAEATFLRCCSTNLALIEDGPATLVYDGAQVHLGRPDAHFRIRAEGVTGVYYREARIPTTLDGEYLVNLVTAARTGGPAGDLALRAFPNPFNPSVRVSFVAPARGMVNAQVFDPAGRRVAVLVSRVMEAGEHALHWDGRGESGARVASGVYFLRVRAGTTTQSIKLVLLR